MNIRTAVEIVLILVAVAGCSTVQERAPTGPMPLQIVELAAEIPLGEKTNVRPSREIFGVYYSHDYGFRLLPEGTDLLGPRIIPEFANDNVEQVFDGLGYLFGEVDPSYMGKAIYCDCSGEHYERSGIPYFLVQEARIFAR